MKQHGVTLIELLIVIVVMGIISAFTVTSVNKILENTKAKVDQENVETLEDVIKTANLEGVLIIKSNKLFNTISNRSYSGTGSWFFEDMADYLENRIIPQADVAKNSNNSDGDGSYKFFFSVKNNDVSIFYYNASKAKIILNTFTLD